MSKRTVVLIALCMTGVIAAAGAAYIASAEPTLESCFFGTDDTDTTCARSAISALLEKENAAMLLDRLEKEIPARRCHAVGHIIGQQLFDRTGNIEWALSECSDGCRRACKHGAVGKALASASGVATSEELMHPNIDLIRSEGRRLCTDTHACHGIGHVLFWLVDGLQSALEMCDSIASPRSQKACWRGVFMENADPFSEIGAPAKNDRDPDDLLSPCRTVPPQYQSVCFLSLSQNQLRTFDERGITDLEEKRRARFKACDELESSNLREACFEGYGSSLFPKIADASVNAERALATCGELSGERERAACAHGYARVLSFHVPLAEAVVFCASIGERLAKSACYESEFDHSTFVGDDDARIKSACLEAHDETCQKTLDLLSADTERHAFVFPDFHW